MVQNAQPVGPNHYRESFGRYYEDFQVGDLYEHRPGRRSPAFLSPAAG